jgi:hypothetical protein
MKLGVAGLLLGASVSLSGCPIVKDALKEPVDSAVKEELADALKASDAKIAVLTARLDQSQKDLVAVREELTKKITFIDTTGKLYRDEYKSASAILASDSTGYAVARTAIGPVLVRLQSITPYLDGFKVRLWLSVLAPIEVNGLKGKISWLEMDPEVLKKDKTAFREKELNFPDTFRPGRYTEVEIALTPASAAGLKSFYVELETNTLTVVPAPPR